MNRSKKIWARLMAVMVMLAFVVSSIALADPPRSDHGRGNHKKERRADRRIKDYDDCYDCRGKRGRGLDKKEDKFINGHDARDGRWDGRGPKTGFRRLPPPRRRIR